MLNLINDNKLDYTTILLKLKRLFLKTWSNKHPENIFRNIGSLSKKTCSNPSFLGSMADQNKIIHF